MTFRPVPAVLALLLLVIGSSLLPNHRIVVASNIGKSAHVLGRVHAINRGLTVQAPHGHAGRGRVKQPLYGKYFLRTHPRQRASFAFLDGTLLHMNQSTDLVLRSPSLTYVPRGEVDEVLVPGSSHRVQTAAAVAAAIGTEFDVRVQKNTTIITVVEGAVLVKNQFGSVVVKTGQQTTVKTGQMPQPVIGVDAKKQTDWVQQLPPPDQPLGENIALDANGGGVVAFSSQRSSANHDWDATNVVDGRTDRGWASAAGKTADEWVKIGFGGNQTHMVSAVIIDPAATAGLASESDLKDFEIRVSTTDGQDAGFTTVLTGTVQQRDSLQRFDLKQPVQAKYVELLARNNYGSPDAISVAELEIVSNEKVDSAAPPPIVLPTTAPTSTPTATATPIPLPPTPAASFTAALPTLLPTPTSVPPPATATPTATSSMPVLQAQPCSQESSLRSQNGDTPTSITFVNQTALVVNIYWIDYNGHRQYYFSLQPGASGLQPTYVTHPWVVTDTSGTCISIFMPTASPSRAIIQ